MAPSHHEAGIVEGTGSAIEVGVKQRGMQHESTIRKYHAACAAKIEEALAA